MSTKPPSTVPAATSRRYSANSVAMTFDARLGDDTGALPSQQTATAPGSWLRSSHLLWLYLPTLPLTFWLLWCLHLPSGEPGSLMGAAPPTLILGLVFGVPHVLASFFAFADPRLASACSRPLWRGLAGAVAVIVLATLLLDDTERLGLMIVLTLLHVMGQQTGLAVGQARLARLAEGERGLRMAVMTWKALLSLLACAAALAVGGEELVGPLVPANPALLVAGTALCLSTPLAGWLGWNAQQRAGDARALLAIQITAAVAYGLVIADQPWFGVILLRWVHDATAFVLYGALAVAENRRQPTGNKLWAPLHHLGLGARSRAAVISVVIWPLAIAATALLAQLPGWIGLAFILTHYFAEPALWRRDSALRASVPLR
ncbi:hypothetical protein AACH06_09650 [Ideonella sp. DXS29W]|uniref:Uncharacterized protein n=1 Tax=Ideonella lacteola TaxID=2984193 RepID=A0ABU9BM96_9BURK